MTLVNDVYFVSRGDDNNSAQIIVNLENGRAVYLNIHYLCGTLCVDAGFDDNMTHTRNWGRVIDKSPIGG